MGVCTVDADVFTEEKHPCTLALLTVEDHVIMELHPAIVAISAAISVRIFDKFHPVPVNTEDFFVHLLNTIHAVILAAFPAG